MKRTTPHAWVMLAILLGAQLVMSMGALGYGPLAPYLREAYGISRGQIGFLIAVFYFTCALAAIPAGVLVDRIGARRMLILCLLMEGIPYAAMPLARNYPSVVFLAALSGIGYAFINQVSTKGIMLWFSSRIRATAMGIKQSGVTIGGAAAAWLLPTLSVAGNWKWGVWSVSVCMFLMALVAALFYREMPLEDVLFSAPLTGGTSERRKNIFTVIRQPTLFTLLLIAPFLAFSQGCLVSFLVLYLKEELLFSVELAGACMMAAMLAATAGRIAWGAVSDVLFKGDRVRPLILLSLAGAAGSLGMALVSNNSPSWAVFGWSMLLGLTLSGWNGVIMILSAELGGTELAASVVSVVVTVVGVGFFSGPVAFGYVADHSGYFASWMLVLGGSCVSACGFLRIYWVTKRHPVGRYEEEERFPRAG